SQLARIGDRGEAWAQAAAGVGERLKVLVGGNRLHVDVLALGPELLDHADGGLAHRTGDAKNGNPTAFGAHRAAPNSQAGACGQPASAAQVNSVAAMSPSMRSRTPPWPGMSLLASFTPNLRFRKDSMRSPINPVKAIKAPTKSQTPVNPDGA